MVYDNTDDNKLLQNPTNNTSPMAIMKDDEELPQDLSTPFSQGDDDDDEKPDSDTESMKTHPQSDTNVDSQQVYNEALADALEIRPTR